MRNLWSVPLLSSLCVEHGRYDLCMQNEPLNDAMIRQDHALNIVYWVALECLPDILRMIVDAKQRAQKSHLLKSTVSSTSFATGGAYQKHR